MTSKEMRVNWKTEGGGVEDRKKMNATAYRLILKEAKIKQKTTTTDY